MAPVAKRATASAICSTLSSKAARKKRKSRGICAQRGAMKATPSPDFLPTSNKRSFKYPTPPRNWITCSSGTPTCCIFGVHQIQLYPEFFFCHNCDEWNKSMLRVNKRHNLKRSARLCCMANHSSFYFPTHRKVIVKPMTPSCNNVSPSSVPHQLLDDEICESKISSGENSIPSSLSIHSLDDDVVMEVLPNMMKQDRLKDWELE